MPDNKNGLVIEVGTGDCMIAYPMARIDYTIHTFEPSTVMRDLAYARLRDFPNVTLMPYAVGGNDRQATLYKCDISAASLHNEGNPQEGCTVVSMNHWFVYARVGEVDYLFLDCNGSEYEILEQMIECDRVRQVDHFGIAWNGEQPERKQAICDVLAQTHQKLCDGFQQWHRIERP